MGEIPYQRRTVGRVHHLGMELDSVETALIIGNGGKGRAVADPHHPESFGNSDHAVAVAHPYLFAPTLFPGILKQDAVVGNLERGAAEFAMVGTRHLAAKLSAHGLLAVTDSKHRNAQRKHRFRGAGSMGFRYRGRAAGENHRHGLEGGDGLVIHGAGMNLGINTAFPHPAGDELGHLGPEIKDEDTFAHAATIPVEAGTGHLIPPLCSPAIPPPLKPILLVKKARSGGRAGSIVTTFIPLSGCSHERQEIPERAPADGPRPAQGLASCMAPLIPAVP